MTDISGIKFNTEGLVPAVAQDIRTKEVLMLAYMDKEALEKTLSTGKAHYWSRSRKTLWLKGETSGNFLHVKSIYYDCDNDAVLLFVEPEGPACHTGERSCFFNRLSGRDHADTSGPAVLEELYKTAVERKNADPAKSYISSLYSKGLSNILGKVMEECLETVEAAEEMSEKELVYETADLWFHTVVLLGYKGIDIGKVFSELKKRQGKSGLAEKISREKKG
ncbi:MAG: bifunctional phosphoribosyl-AMP cyclohydrolase/phosphoribosyl-ATP diphosphatase HisIE [Deltaproteobacteria bacterium]|nr:bifunctional phosphoribosyl-AMP cyclohydrolase/phosphoribosyl-ATP diphosphatase HisIE [Deltaproteobacteria bacterium]